MKKILFIGGILPEKKLNEIISNSICNVDFAAHNFQKKILKGLDDNNCSYDVLSVPFISSFPKYYKKIKINEFNDRNMQYLKFVNLPYYRIFSRYLTLKRRIKKYSKYNQDFDVIIYSLHYPFIKNAKNIKKKFPQCKINLVVPDLQEFMSTKTNFIFKMLNKIEIKKTNKYLKYIDNYVFLTEYMNNKLNVYNKPYVVVEGISNFNLSKETNNFFNETEKYFAYTGTLAKRYGIMHLVNAFLKTKRENIKLIICGHGEMAEQLKKISLENDKIIYKGLVSPEESAEIQKKAFALINPRMNDEEYTKYSFPSKILEYISNGKPIICYKLDGFPNEYDDILIYPKDNSIESLSDCIDEVANYSNELIAKIKKNSAKFIELKSPKKMVEKILNLYNNN